MRRGGAAYSGACPGLGQPTKSCGLDGWAGFHLNSRMADRVCDLPELCKRRANQSRWNLQLPDAEKHLNLVSSTTIRQTLSVSSQIGSPGTTSAPAPKIYSGTSISLSQREKPLSIFQQTVKVLEPHLHSRIEDHCRGYGAESQASLTRIKRNEPTPRPNSRAVLPQRRSRSPAQCPRCCGRQWAPFEAPTIREQAMESISTVAG
ncbi:hypothetical protein GGD64_007715 [Bradyrhizobium sp. CIR3A]|nr:hypothetical protein [Bradyrhizobium sp. CIR3A]